MSGRAGSIATALSLLHLRVGRYIEVANWIVLDTVWRFRWRLGRFLFASGLALAMQAGALLLFMSYARRLEGKEALKLADITLDLSSSYLLLVAAIGFGGALFVASSFFKIYADRGFSELGWRYGVLCAERLITLASAALHAKSSNTTALDRAEIQKLVMSASQICSRAMYGLIGTLPVLAGLLVYTGFLVYLDFALTAFILAAMILSFVFYYSLSIQASTLMRERQEKKQAMAVDLGHLVDVIRTAPRPLGPEHTLIDAKIRHGTFSQYFAHLFRPKLLTAQSGHVSAIVQATVLTVIGLIKGGAIIATGAGFGDLVIFLVAGRMAMTHFLRITNALVMINRFYPTVANYFRTVERLRQTDNRALVAESGLSGRALQLVARPLGEAAPERPPEVAPGTRFGLITPRPADRFAVIEVLSAFRFVPGETYSGGGRVPPGQCWLVPEEIVQAAVSFIDATGLPQDMDRASLNAELAALGMSDEVLAGLPSDLAVPMDQQAWDRLRPEAVWAGHLLAAGYTDQPLIVVGAEALDAVGGIVSDNILDRLLADRIVLIAYRPSRITGLGAFEERYVILFDDENVLGYLGLEDVEAKIDLIKDMERTRKEKDIGSLDDMGLDDM
jgi:ABC-type multidrug transport system fused ATPase/permease subunit